MSAGDRPSMPRRCRCRNAVSQTAPCMSAGTIRRSPPGGKARPKITEPATCGQGAQTTYIPQDLARPIMARSTVFTTDRSQAVRLPKPVAFPAGVREVEIIKLGRARLLTPVGRRWDDFF